MAWLWLDATLGIAGDMVCAALLDLGASEESLRQALATLPLEGYAVNVTKVLSGSIACRDFDVVLAPELETHDHDMAWLYGEGSATDSGEEKRPESVHGVPEHHGHHAYGTHHHRTLAEVEDILYAGSLSKRALEMTLSCFRLLAQAEAEAHGTTPEEVRFHEVGAVDSIVDIASACILLDDLSVEGVVVEGLTDGHGTVNTAHGRLPIPVPAVLAVTEIAGLPLSVSDAEGERVTPTGAALAATFRTREELPARFRIVKTGRGAGKRTYGGPSFVRAVLLEPLEDAGRLNADDSPEVAESSVARKPFASQSPETAPGTPPEPTVTKLECDVDDDTGESFGHIIGLLMDEGAHEAHWIPLGTKKGRPSWQLQVLCREEDRERLENVIFENTTTIGIRHCSMGRRVLPRTFVTLETAFGPITGKRVELPSGRSRIMPEQSDVARIARERKVPYQEVWQAALGAGYREAGSSR